MKSLLVFLLIITTMTGWTQETPVHLSVSSNPSGVQIRLNSIIMGVTPLNNITVQPGVYTIEALSVENGIWNAKNIIQEITIAAGRDTTVHIEFPRLVKINSIPFHAKLLFENQVMGFTPTFVDLEKFKGKNFSLEKTGYQTISFHLKESEQNLFILKPLDITANQNDRNSFGYNLFHSRMKTKFIFLTGTVVTHWLSFYFKNLADDNYEKYLTTGNPVLMNNYWEKTQKYDNYSHLTLGISYAFLGGLIYTVLWH